MKTRLTNFLYNADRTIASLFGAPRQEAPYTIMEGRPYSMSLVEVLHGAQRYAQGIRNSRLDNLALALNRPRTRAAGTPTNPSKSAWAPGMVDGVTDPKQVEVHPIDNMTPDALQEEALCGP